MTMTAVARPDPVQLVIERLHNAGCNPKQSRRGQWNARCPVADGHKRGDRNPSLSVGTGPDGKALLHCNTGCTTPDVARALDLHVADLFPDRPHATIDGGKRIRATYPYYDLDGTLVFEVVRYDPKTFRQRRPDGHGGWVWNLQGVDERPLYHLPQVRRAIELGQTVWIVEGEKDAENLQWEVDGAVTCNSGGAGKWRHENTRQLEGARRVVIISDNDDVGLEHARSVAADLYTDGHRDIEVLGPPDGFKDVSEALGAGKDLSTFALNWDITMGEAWLRGADQVADPTNDPDPLQVTDEVQEALESDWAPIDLAAIARDIIAGTREPTLPTIANVDGTHPLFYAARVNSLFGESGGGKTFLAQQAAADCVRAGQRVLVVDFEDHADGWAERLCLLGLTPDEISLITYRNPATSLLAGLVEMEDE